MKHRLLCLFFILIAGAALLPAQTSDLVDTDLAERMVQLFPELTDGYIDLNANGSLDRFQDMDEQIPESMIQDQTLQVQEVLDFILANFRFFSVERLQQVRGALDDARGDIPEIIAISYRDRLGGAIEDKRELDDEGLYLPPSVMARAQEEMAGYIATMVHSFRKEEGEYAEQFEQAREQLFSMMEAGYPLPSISDADESLLSSAMIHTIATAGTDDPARVKAAIRTLGRLQSEQAIPHLTQLLDSQEFRGTAAEALGEIGTNTTRTILTKALDRSTPGAYQNALIRAVGRVGGSRSAERIISLADDNHDATSGARDKMRTVLEAMVDLTKQGNRNRELYQTMSSYLEDSDPAFRRVAAEGIAAYGGRNALGLLQPRLQEEENEDVLLTLVRELRAYDEVSVLSSYTSLLGEPSTSVRVRREIIQAIGAHSNGERVVTTVMEYLEHESEELRDAAGYPHLPVRERCSSSRRLLEPPGHAKRRPAFSHRSNGASRRARRSGRAYRAPQSLGISSREGTRERKLGLVPDPPIRQRARGHGAAEARQQRGGADPGADKRSPSPRCNGPRLGAAGGGQDPYHHPRAPCTGVCHAPLLRCSRLG